MPTSASPSINNYGLHSGNNQLYVFSSWGNLGYGGDKLTWLDYRNEPGSGDRRVISPKFYADYEATTDEFLACDIASGSSSIVHMVDYVNIVYVANVQACSSSICASGLSDCSPVVGLTSASSANINNNNGISSFSSGLLNPVTAMSLFVRQLATGSLSSNGTTCSCQTGITCPESGSSNSDGIYGDRIIFTGTLAPNQPVCKGTSSSQDCNCECRKLISLVYPSIVTDGRNHPINVTSFSLYSRSDSCSGNGCAGYSEDFSDTLCGGFLGTRMLYTYANESNIANGVNCLVTSNYGVRYMFGGTDYNLFGNVNGYTVPHALITNITDTSTNNGMYVYNNAICT
jgi:hypothetical protein